MKRKFQAIAITAILIIATSFLAISLVPKISVSAKPVKIACIGDSITRGSGYTEKLQSLLGKNYTVGNFGVDGSTVTQKSNKTYMAQPQFTEALKFRPDIVVIMLGTNDANKSLSTDRQTFENNYKQLVNSFENLEGDQKIWIVRSPPIQNTSVGLSQEKFDNEVLPEIDQVASELKIPTINAYDAFGDHSEYFADGVHPNGDGATLLAATVCIAITQDTFY